MRKWQLFILQAILFLVFIHTSWADDTPIGHIPSLHGNVPHVTDGTNYFDIRDATTADGTTGNGVQASGIMGFDGTNFQTIAVDTSGNLSLSNTSATPAGTNNIGDVDIEIVGTAVTVNTESTSQAADFDLNAATTNLRLMGLTIRESTATAAVATVVIRHGITSGGNCTGDAFAIVELNSNQSIQIQFQPRGLLAASGVCVDRIAGTVDAGSHTTVEAAP